MGRVFITGGKNTDRAEPTERAEETSGPRARPERQRDSGAAGNAAQQQGKSPADAVSAFKTSILQ